METSTRPFPFATAFSLNRLVAFWEAAEDGPLAPLAALIRERLAGAPDLHAPDLDPDALHAHGDLVDLMLSAVFPRAQWDESVAALLPPFGTGMVYATPTSERLGLFGAATLHEQMDLDPRGFELGRTMMAYYLVLERCYGITVPYDFPLLLNLSDAGTELERHFKLLIDTQFVWVETRGARPPLGETDLARLVASPTDRALWEQMLPPERFALHGFTIATALDVTDEQVLSALRDDLLEKAAMTSEASVVRLERRLRSLLRSPDLRFGLICLEDGDDLGETQRVRAIGRSLLLSSGAAPVCPRRGESVYAQALGSGCPVVVSDLAAHEPQTGYEDHLLAEGFGSLLVAPLRVGERTVGLLELAAPQPGALNAFNTMKIEEVASVFATALQRSLDEREDHIQAVIKSQCTAIHPVVEWRFREAALRYIEATPGAAPGERRQLEPIVFPGVLPLYGASDIRDSSTHRNAAIAADLAEQLSLAFAVVVEASAHRSLPGLDELGFRLQCTIDEVGAGLRTEHEAHVAEFLRRDVESLFDHLAPYGAGVRDRVAAYRAALDPTLGMRYEARRHYEESVTKINETIACHLERQDDYAQRLVPHYFENYKTDGVEHNLYVGDALLEDRTVDPLAVRNLRLWQLMATCSTAWALDRIAPDLPMPLQVAHLVLVQTTPLAIRFRYDEKQFDVDGAYNTRYEIVKKRIDKACVAGTEERLTQPGHLAIAFTPGRAAQEYQTYLDYLRAAGYLGAPVEEVALEPMPGVHGLRAFRVPVAPQPPGMELDVTPERARAAALEAS
ncbi:MAG: GAF domain-containing protein [Bacteroidota bacterium]